MRTLTLALILNLFATLCLAAASLEDGYDAYERGEVDRAVQIWRTLAEQGNSTAQLNLGQLYRTGRGVALDDREAVKWYSLAAKQGSDTARYNLILMHEEGRATREDLGMAFTSPPPETAEVAQQATQPADVPPTNAVTSPEPEAGDTAGAGDANVTDGYGGWFTRLPAPAYVLQLVSAPRQTTLQQYAVDHLGPRASEALVVHTIRKGKNHHLLLLGPFDSQREGTDMIAQLSPEVQKNKPWARPAASIQPKVKGVYPAAPGADDWFSNLPQQQYVLQLVSSSNRSSLQRYAKKHLGNLNLGWQWDIVLAQRKGQDFYLLLLGPFDSRGQASEMITRLPETVKNNKPYPRSANAVQRIAK